VVIGLEMDDLVGETVATGTRALLCVENEEGSIGAIEATVAVAVGLVTLDKGCDRVLVGRGVTALMLPLLSRTYSFK
jgi:hypothetical protein